MTSIDQDSAFALSESPESQREIRIQAEYFEGQLDLKRFRVTYPHYRVLHSDPLILEPETGRYVVIAKFGGVAFWNCKSELIQSLLEELSALPGSGERVEQVTDTLTVLYDQEEEEVNFNEVRIRTLTLEKLKLISIALAQSVALDRFEIELSHALESVRLVTIILREEGKLSLSEEEVLKAIGFGLEVRGSVLANLTLFDSPPETWESEALAHLDSLLFDHFDLEERQEAIDKKVDFLQDLNVMLLDLIAVRKSRRLEWIGLGIIGIEFAIFSIQEIIPWILRNLFS